MTRYLLDTNHLSALLKRNPLVESRVNAGIQRGDRFGITLPVLCEFRAGIAIGKKSQWNLARFKAATASFRYWPLDEQTAIEFATLSNELRKTGRPIGQFDALIAASARQHRLTLLTADSDFQAVPRLRQENWLK